MTQTDTLIRRFLAPKSNPKEIATGIFIAYVLTAIGLVLLGIFSGDTNVIFRAFLMVMFLTLAPLISFAGLASAGSVAFTSMALLIYVGLWVFAVRKLSGLMLRVAAVILVGSWMVFGLWASSRVY